MIGLIFGDTDFPKEILKTIKKKKIKYLIVDLSKSKKFKKDKKSYAVSIGQFGKIINILKENKCKQVLFAGKVNKPNFSKLKSRLVCLNCFIRSVFEEPDISFWYKACITNSRSFAGEGVFLAIKNNIKNT